VKRLKSETIKYILLWLITYNKIHNYNMLQRYINKLIDQRHTTQHIDADIVFEGGLFNGSYQLGFLTYIKQMEKLNLIRVKRISGCSIGAFIALLYFIDVSLDDNIDFVSNVIYKHAKKHHNINIFDKTYAFYSKRLPNNFLDIINGKLFITYNDVSKNKQIVKSHYASIEELFDVIRRSCSMPYIIDKNLFYNNKYIDGLYPYIFKPKKDRKIINLNIINWRKLDFFTIKNENNNIQRVINGIMDTHAFFSVSSDFFPISNMCSYVDEWSIITRFKYMMLVKLLQLSISIFHYIYIFIRIFKKHYHDDITPEFINTLFVVISKFVFKIFCV
jgi:hypothetical protein